MRIVIQDPDTVVAISTLREAVDYLMYQWPATHGARHHDALNAFTKALKGSGSIADDAEKAFAAAAHEAHLIVQEPQAR